MENTVEDKKSKMSPNDEIEFQIEIATQTLDRNIGFITNCDNKTSIVLAIVGVLLTIILTNDGINAIYNIINTCVEEKTFCTILYLFIWGITVLVMICGMYNLCGVLIAKTSETVTGIGVTNSRIFFTGISKHGNCEVYKEKFCEMSGQEYLDELIAQIYINADIAIQKYSKYNAGLQLTVIGFCLFVIILIVGIYLY